MGKEHVVKCAECESGNLYLSEECTRVETDTGAVYLCLHHAHRYRCDNCKRVEYTPYCRATHYCAECSGLK